MSIVFELPAETQGIKPIEEFPVEIKKGSSSAILFSDELSEAFLLTYIEAALLQTGPVYHVQVGGGFNTSLLQKIQRNVNGFFWGRGYRLSSVVDAVKSIGENSSLVVSGFSLLPDKSPELLMELLELAGERGLTLILTNTPLVINELNLPEEFLNHYLLPELFDYLFVARMSSYRGHYRLNLSFIRLPGEYVKFIGEYSIPVDSKVAPLLE